MRLIWAVDPFSDPGFLISAAKSAAGLARSGVVELIPVFALPPWMRPSAQLDFGEGSSGQTLRGTFAGPVWPSDPGVIGRVEDEARAQFAKTLRRLSGSDYTFDARDTRVEQDVARNVAPRSTARGAARRPAPKSARRVSGRRSPIPADKTERGVRILPLKVLGPGEDAPENAGLGYQADEISNYALEIGAASILVCTHARRRPTGEMSEGKPGEQTGSAKSEKSGASRHSPGPMGRIAGSIGESIGEWLIGSFAETLIERADVPVISVHPVSPRSMHSVPRLQRYPELLFATDFSPESAQAFDSALEFARELRLPVLIYHCLELPTPILDFAYSPYLLYANERRQEHAHVQAANWVTRARERGVAAQARFDESVSSVAESVARVARERNSLIAIAAKSSPAAAALLGSVTRKLIRLSANPVWVMHVSRRKTRAASRAA